MNMSDIDELLEMTQLSDMVVMFPKRNIGRRNNVFEGEIRSSTGIRRSCVIKFATISQENLNEAKILSNLDSHSHVITLIQSGVYHDLLEEHFYLALDKCHPENLRQYYANRREACIEFDAHQTLDYAKQIMNGVTYLHDNKIIHLDLKPSNILLSCNLRSIKIADFGVSVLLEPGQSKIFHKRQFGTNGYRPLESFGNSWVSLKTDIFSLGALLYHLFSNGKEAFGNDEHAFLNNVMNDITDTSVLLVCNPKAAENLIKSMINRERCRRPIIQQVAHHPFWAGQEVECNFDYYVDEENDVMVYPEQLLPSTERSISDFVREMQRTGFYRKPTIVVFDHKSETLWRIDLTTRQRHTTMHPYCRRMLQFFRATSLGEYIYVLLRDSSVYRLEYGDRVGTWERMADVTVDHGFWAPVATSNSSIYISSGRYVSPSRLVSKFDPLQNEWSNTIEKTIATCFSTMLVKDGFLYCFGGIDENLETINSVERIDLSTMECSDIASMKTLRSNASAVDCRDELYVIGGLNRNERAITIVEAYNLITNQWTLKTPVNKPRRVLNAFLVDKNIYVLGGGRTDGDNQLIEKYDFNTDQWSVVMTLRNMLVWNSVLVMMSR